MKRKGVGFTTVIIVAGALAGTGIPFRTAGMVAFGAAKASEVQRQTAPAIPHIPDFADRAKMPAFGKQGPPAKAAALMGDRRHGEVLFAANCRSCHGPRGAGNVPNPGSGDGTVPPLNPLDPGLTNRNPSLFAANIDRIIQHGSLPDGPHPVLFMPDWGDSGKLSQQEIADIEAYIMYLNGVERKKGARL